MNVLHPEYFVLAPLIAIPILIHLLNRIRYRRVRWAAIDFLLNSERRAVRRARLRQWLLMALRTLLLAAALGALLQPSLGGSLAGLLGGSSQTAIVLDTSASMSATVASGQIFETAKKLASATLAGLSANTKATVGTFAVRYDTPFREPVKDRRAPMTVIESARLTGGAGDIPRAIRRAAASLGKAGGGTIWLLTDLQASGWRATDNGAWEQTRQALDAAGKPNIVISDLSPDIDANYSIDDIRTSPAVLVEGSEPKLTATIRLAGSEGGSTNVSVFLDGKRIDSRIAEFATPGKLQITFRLPKLSSGDHAGRIELDADAMPADDIRHFVLRTNNTVAVLVVDGAPATGDFEASGDFLALAADPPGADPAGRSPFSVKRTPLTELSSVDLAKFAAVFVADPTEFDLRAAKQLREYVEAGGLLMIFPGSHTNVHAWNNGGFPGLPAKGVIQAEDGPPIKVGWASPTDPVTATLPAEGLDRVDIKRLFRLDAEGKGQVLATTDGGDAFLVRMQMGRGKTYVFAVSAQVDCSNLPLTPVLLLTVHRAVLSHLMQVGEPLSHTAFSEIAIELPPGRCKIQTPDERLLPVFAGVDTPGRATFGDTGLTGIYRLIEGDAPPTDAPSAPIIAAVNVPAEESSLDRIDADAVRGLLSGHQVTVLRGTGGSSQAAEGVGQTSPLTFHLAVLAALFLLGEVLLAWSMDRPEQTPAAEIATPEIPARAAS